MLSKRIVKVEALTQLVELSMITFSLTSAMNMAAMSGVSSQHDHLVVTFWTAVNKVITFILLPMITFLTFWTVVNTVMSRSSTMILVMNRMITFELLPVITLLVKSSTTVNTAAKIAFREKKSLVRV